MHSAIYVGRVTHRRSQPVRHCFTVRLYAAYLDLEELPGLLDRSGMVSTHRWAPVSFDRGQHLRGRPGALDEAVRKLIEEQTGLRPLGPVRLLTQLRYFGYYFSPLNLYYCFDASDQRVEAVVAEVNNTPWGEQHCYVFRPVPASRTGSPMTFSHPKSFHVSPFMGMEVDYHWRLSVPTEHLMVQIDNSSGGETFFRASLSLARRPLDRSQLHRMMLRYPLMTGWIMAAIHWQALRLWWKQCPFYPHPRKAGSPVR